MTRTIKIEMGLNEAHGGNNGSLWRVDLAGGYDGEMKPSELRVAIVDDNKDAAALFGRLIELAGFSLVAEIYDATQAFHRIQEQKPHVAILDISMPFLDGCTIARRVRERIVPPPLLIALSGFGTPNDKQQAIEAGFDYHLTKPANWQQLEGILSRHFQIDKAID
jgi:CheY-like chemotaxis protein